MNKKIFNLVLVAVFSALILILTFVPNLGYIMIGPVSITIIHIVVLMAIFLLPFFHSLFIGTFMGVSSLVAAFLYAKTPFDMIFQNPVVSVLPRMLFCEFAYFIKWLFFKVCKKETKDYLTFLIFSILYILSFIFLPKGIHFMLGKYNIEKGLIELLMSLILGISLCVYFSLKFLNIIKIKTTLTIPYFFICTVFHTFIVLLYFKIMASHYNQELPNFSMFFYLVISTNGILEVLLAVSVGPVILNLLKRVRRDLFEAFA